MQLSCYRIADLGVKISVRHLFSVVIDTLMGIEDDLRGDPFPDADSLRACRDSIDLLTRLADRFPEIDLGEHIRHVAVG